MANQSNQNGFRYKLSVADKKLILNGSSVLTTQINLFHSILRSCSEKLPPKFQPRSLAHLKQMLQCPGVKWVQNIQEDSLHLQILHNCNDSCHTCVYDNNWICSYYDTKLIRIYDAPNRNKLCICSEQYLNQLFPQLIT